MLGWLDFLIINFWIIFSLFLFNNSFLMLMIYSELIWVILYTISVLLGSYNDDINLVTLTFFILGFSGLEFIVGFLLIILLKNFSINIKKNNNNSNKIMRQKFNIKNINTKKWNL